MNLADIEDKLKKVQEFKLVEHALATAKAAAATNTKIHTVGAEDAAESERSIKFPFTVEETWSILATVMMVLETRHSKLEAEIKD